MVRLVLPLLAIVALAVGCGSSTVASILPGSEREKTGAEKLQLWPENRSAWRIEVEPMIASRTGGSIGLGPREELQPGPEKVASKGFGIKPFEVLSQFPKVDVAQGDVYMLHLSAQQDDHSPFERELFLTIPRRIVDKPGPRETRLVVDSKGATFILGSVRRFEPWSPTEP